MLKVGQVEHGWQAGQAVQEEQRVHVVGRGEGSWQTVKIEQKEVDLSLNGALLCFARRPEPAWAGCREGGCSCAGWGGIGETATC
jgi:hypothetical protein